MKTKVGAIMAPTLAITSSNAKYVEHRIANIFGLPALQVIQYAVFDSECDSDISYALQIKDGLGSLVNIGKRYGATLWQIKGRFIHG